MRTKNTQFSTFTALQKRLSPSLSQKTTSNQQSLLVTSTGTLHSGATQTKTNQVETSKNSAKQPTSFEFRTRTPQQPYCTKPMGLYIALTSHWSQLTLTLATPARSSRTLSVTTAQPSPHSTSPSSVLGLEEPVGTSEKLIGRNSAQFSMKTST